MRIRIGLAGESGSSGPMLPGFIAGISKDPSDTSFQEF
jgi:hypothetical protein